MPSIADANAFDSFSRTLPNVWGSADSGEPWVILNPESTFTAFDVNGGSASIHMPSFLRAAWLETTERAEQEILVKLKIETSVGAEAFAGAILRLANGGTEFYGALIDPKTKTLQQWTNPTSLGLVHATAADFFLGEGLSVGQWWWLRFKVEGGFRYAKAWIDGTAEPGSWQSVTELRPDGPVLGRPGVWVRRVSDSAFTAHFDTLYYWDITHGTKPGMPRADDFVRDTAGGFGISAAGHLWSGNVADDPAVTVRGSKGSTSASGGSGVLNLEDTSSYVGLFGLPAAGDQETLTLVKFGGAVDQAATLRIGVRGQLTTDGAAHGHGYVFEVTNGGTAASVRKKTAYNGAYTTLASGSIVAPLLDTDYWARVQVIGTTVRGRWWKDGDAEPGTWTASAVDSSIVGEGTGWFEVVQSDTATARSIVFDDFNVTSSLTTDGTTTGALSVSGATDTSFDFSVAYSFDDDDDNSVTVQYKRTNVESWTTFGSPTADRVGLTWSGTISGLDEGAAYDLKVTFADPDGVLGTNPRTASVSTLTKGVTTGVVIATAATDQLDVVATYADDSDDDSSATVEYRSVGATTTFVSDTLTDPSSVVPLHEHVGEIGATWTQHATSGGSLTVDADGTLYSTVVDATHLYYTSAVPATADYAVEAVVIAKSFAAEAGVALRISTTLNDYYTAAWRFDDFADVNEWYIAKVVGGTATDLVVVAGPTTPAVGDRHTLRLAVQGSVLTLYVDSVAVAVVSNAEITDAGRAGVRFHSAASSPLTRGFVLDDVRAYSYGSYGSWVDGGAMTADRPTKRFTSTITGLTLDSTYEVRVTYADADSFVRGVNPTVATATTLGRGVRLLTVEATATETGAVVLADYDLDTNNNSSVSFRYRGTRDALWTTVGSERVTVDRVGKQFALTLTGLRPSLSYNVEATVADPDGPTPNTAVTLSTVFTTLGGVIDPDRRSKHYVWKVYDHLDAYLGTWRDAPEPEFSLQENGGVTDLLVVLPRTLRQAQGDPTIAAGNRVDVWAIDGLSDGMGRNLIHDWDMDLGSWTLNTGWLVRPDAGPDDGSALRFGSTSADQYQVLSETIELSTAVPLVLTAVARATGGKLRVDIAAYDAGDVLLDTSDDNAETVGTTWQRLKLTWTPPADTAYVRVRAENIGKGVMVLDKVVLLPQEKLIYRGKIESHESRFTQEGESVEIEILGLVSQLSDQYVEFLQWVEVQPTRDVNAGRIKTGLPTDPANMLKKALDVAAARNPRFALYYTDDSIKLTGQSVSYTFRDQLLRAVCDKIRDLCPPGWHYWIESDGLVHLRGPEHTKTHKLRLGREIMEFKNETSIRNLKNLIRVRGRQDEDASEADGFGSINHVSFDQIHIDRYGLREMFHRDAQIVDPETAEIVGDGRLDERNRVEQRVSALVPDEKDLDYTGTALLGYNIEDFEPGDLVEVYDPTLDGSQTFWDHFVWDEGQWASSDNVVIEEGVPIRNVRYRGTHAELELSQRQPSATSDFARFVSHQQRQESDSSD